VGICCGGLASTKQNFDQCQVGQNPVVVAARVLDLPADDIQSLFEFTAEIYRRNIGIEDDRIDRSGLLGPKLRRVQPVYPSRFAPNLLHQVLRAAGAVTTLSVPQANEVYLPDTKTFC
jgi:hypothetical protein